jgi:hypothetical protein
VSSLGRIVSSPLRGLGHLVDSAGGEIPGGVPAAWAALAIAVGVVAWLVARAAGRSRLAGAAASSGSRPARADDLERDAAVAEREQRFADAVRLRFRAGLMRLADRDRIPSGRAVATHEVSLALGSERFDALARRFDEIAYGGASAGPADAQEQRHGWPEVLAGDRG